MHAGIEMTVNLPGHPVSVTHTILTRKHCTNLFVLSIPMHRFQLIECDVYV